MSPSAKACWRCTFDATRGDVFAEKPAQGSSKDFEGQDDAGMPADAAAGDSRPASAVRADAAPEAKEKPQKKHKRHKLSKHKPGMACQP